MGDAGDLGGLTGGESLVRVEARGGGEEALAAERFVDAGETAGKLMGGIEERGVGVGQGGVAVEPSGVEARTEAGAFEVGEEADGSVGPDAPLAEEAAVDVARAARARVEQLRNTVLPQGIEATITRDYGETAADKANKLIQKLAFATASVIFLVGLALGKREAVIVGGAVILTLTATLFVLESSTHALTYSNKFLSLL